MTDTPRDDKSTLRDLQHLTQAFVAERDWHQFHSPRNLAMALSVEAAELLELYLWSTDEGPQPPVSTRHAKVADEAADVLICLLNFAAMAEIDLAAALHTKLERAREKYPIDHAKGRALKYDEYT